MNKSFLFVLFVSYFAYSGLRLDTLTVDNGGKIRKINSDTVNSIYDSAKIVKADSINSIDAIRTNRVYFGISKGDTTYSVTDTSKRIRTDSIKVFGKTNSISSTTGTIQCDGGVSVDSSIWCGKYLMQQGIYGAINIYDNSTAQSVPTGATYTKLTCFPSIGLNSYVTCDTANDKITFTKTGKYRVSATLSFSCGTNNVEWRVAGFLNNVEQNQLHFIRKIGTAGDVGNAGITGFINVSTEPWDLDLRARHDNGGSVDLTVVYGNLNVEYVGE
jgi:hypothetical protein